MNLPLLIYLASDRVHCQGLMKTVVKGSRWATISFSRRNELRGVGCYVLVKLGVRTHTGLTRGRGPVSGRYEHNKEVSQKVYMYFVF